MEYRVLMHGERFVDVNRLAQGIYSVPEPKLYPIGITKEDIQDRHQTFANINFGAINNGRYMAAVIENLSKCEWKLFKLEAVKASQK